MCIRIPDFPWRENWVYTNFSPGENLLYTRFSGGKFEYIPIFPEGNSSMGEKLGCTGPAYTNHSVIYVISLTNISNTQNWNISISNSMELLKYLL